MFLIGMLFGVGMTIGIQEVRDAPKGPVCIVESGDSFWSRKKQEVPCAKDHP
ncbi:hypothetical protein [Acidovorax sp. FG27]|uniref:hypothetical protein n=1 Tax=Acidovorax sp. FG27 TaxID=3133652 RepID=UPI00333F7786